MFETKFVNEIISMIKSKHNIFQNETQFFPTQNAKVALETYLQINNFLVVFTQLENNFVRFRNAA